MGVQLVVFDIAGTTVLGRARETFHALKRAGIRVALDSEFDRATVDRVIDRMGWRDLVDVSVAGDEVDRIRPYPDLVGRAMVLAGVTSSRDVAKVAFSLDDLRAATAAGCGRIIRVAPRMRPLSGADPLAHTECVADLTDVLPLCLGAESDHLLPPAEAAAEVLGRIHAAP
jgi:beta-phosphoglucomutase-like phosphatase (HAD superfamily)